MNILYSIILTTDLQIPIPPALLNEMEQLYAPPDHPVFTLVLPTFHECTMELYLSIGEPEVYVSTFWDIYHDLLGRLQEPADDQLTDVLHTFQANVDNSTEDMEPFCLDKLLELGGRTTYVGRLEEDSQALPLDFNRPGAEFTLSRLHLLFIPLVLGTYTCNSSRPTSGSNILLYCTFAFVHKFV